MKLSATAKPNTTTKTTEPAPATGAQTEMTATPATLVTSARVPGTNVTIQVWRTTGSRFGGLYYATNDYGEPRCTTKYFATRDECLAVEFAELNKMLVEDGAVTRLESANVFAEAL